MEQMLDIDENYKIRTSNSKGYHRFHQNFISRCITYLQPDRLCAPLLVNPRSGARGFRL